MKIGVLSDTHDSLENLQTALSTYWNRDIKTIIHCGDLVSLDMISHFTGFRLIYTFGNMDITTGTIKKRIEAMNDENFAGMVYRGKLSGVPIAATHSHIEGKMMELAREKRYKWIFYGHTHKKRDEVIHGVRMVNPGALGGLAREQRSYCIVDLEAENVEFLQIP